MKENFFQEFNIRLYDKNSESDFFFPPPKSEYFFSNIGNQNIFLEKKHSPPPLELKRPVPSLCLHSVAGEDVVEKEFVYCEYI